MIARLVVRGFRSLADLTWQPSPGRHLLVGGTGAGKTSVLEAIYLAATTRSFRTHQLSDCLRHDLAQADPGSAGFFVQIEVEPPRRTRLEVGWSPEQGLWRSVDGSSGSLSEHLEVLPVLSWTTADVDVLTGEPELRRRLIDRGIVADRPSTLTVLSRYRRALQHKRRLLAERQRGLRAWTEVLAAAAVEVVALRRDYVAARRDVVSEVLEESALGYPTLEIDYRPSPRAALEGEDEALAALEAQRQAEVDRSRPLIGPHRDRIEVLWGGRELGRVASAGERKAIGLLLLAAQARLLERRSRAPVLLLDDADVELDRPTLGALWGVLARASQIVASSNRPEVWEALEIEAHWQVRDGHVEGPVEGL